MRAATSPLLQRNEYLVDTPRNATARRAGWMLLEAIITDANIDIFDKVATKNVELSKLQYLGGMRQQVPVQSM